MTGCRTLEPTCDVEARLPSRELPHWPLSAYPQKQCLKYMAQEGLRPSPRGIPAHRSYTSSGTNRTLETANGGRLGVRRYGCHISHRWRMCPEKSSPPQQAVRLPSPGCIKSKRREVIISCILGPISVPIVPITIAGRGGSRSGAAVARLCMPRRVHNLGTVRIVLCILLREP
jgi:hypothetical protein